MEENTNDTPENIEQKDKTNETNENNEQLEENKTQMETLAQESTQEKVDNNEQSQKETAPEINTEKILIMKKWIKQQARRQQKGTTEREKNNTNTPNDIKNRERQN